MGRPNPKNNPTMQRVEAPAKSIVKPATPPPIPVKTSTAKRPRRTQTISSSSTNAEQSRNVTQPVKKQTGWCNCEFWDLPCKAGCLAQEQIVGPVVSGTEWLAGGADVHITQPIVSGTEWLAGGVDVHVTQPITEGVEWWQGGFDEAWIETEKFFGGVAEDIGKTQDEIDQLKDDTITNLTTIGEDVQKTLAGGTQWLQDQAGTAGNMFTDIARMPSGLGSMMGNMMRGMGNLANVGSSSMGWIKWVLIAIGALIAGFIAWRVLK
jgi:hypothetical protein